MNRIGQFLARGFSRCRAAVVAVWAAGLTAAGLSFFALLISTAGAAVLTGMTGIVLDHLIKVGHSDQVFYLGAAALALVGFVLLGQQRLLGGSMKATVELLKFKAELQQGGDDERAS